VNQAAYSIEHVLPIAVSTLGIVLIVLAVIIVLLAAGGYAAATRRAKSSEGALQHELERAERELARAHASDKGWDPVLLAAAAEAAATERFGDATVGSPLLVQVVDRPGTDADQAVFLIKTADGDEHRMTLGRAGGVWGPA
jgi:type II secretory pathway pseudopilin PulG